MKKIVVVVSILLIFLSSASSETTKKKSQPKKAQQTEEQSDLDALIEKQKKESAEREIQTQYYFNLLRINTELKQQHSNLKYYYKQIRLQGEEERLELSYRGRIPYSVSVKRQKLEDDRVKAEDKIKDLEKEKDNLKLDILKYYSGSMPTYLSDKWTEEENKYGEFIKQYTEELRQLY